MLTAKQRWIQFEKREGRPPTLDEWCEWGYHRKYYYQVRREIERGEA